MINTKKRLGRKQTTNVKHNNIYLLFVDNVLRIVTTNARDIYQYVESCRIWYKGYDNHYVFYAFRPDIFGNYQQTAREQEYI